MATPLKLETQHKRSPDREPPCCRMSLSVSAVALPSGGHRCPRLPPLVTCFRPLFSPISASLPIPGSLPYLFVRRKKIIPRHPSLCIQAKGTDHSQNGGVGRRRIWRRRKLTRKDEMLRYAEERTPFVEEQVRDIWETGKLAGYDIERLKLWEDNIFAFVRNLAAEANELVENNKDEYGGKKKAILHAISNRMNEMGFYRPEAYMRTDPFKHITKTTHHHEDE